VNANFSMIMSINQTTENYFTVPIHLKHVYRVIAMIEPDNEVLLRCKCVQYGMKVPNILASRLKLLYDIAHGCFLSLQSKHQLTLNSFIEVLRMIHETQNSNADSRPASFAGAGQQSVNKIGATKVESILNV
jgi:hypothetical protein